MPRTTYLSPPFSVDVPPFWGRKASSQKAYSSSLQDCKALFSQPEPQSSLIPELQNTNASAQPELGTLPSPERRECTSYLVVTAL